MSTRQFGATMAELTVASREALSSVRIYQVDTRDVPSALRSLSAVPGGGLDVLEGAIRLRRSLEPTQLTVAPLTGTATSRCPGGWFKCVYFQLSPWPTPHRP